MLRLIDASWPEAADEQLARDAAMFEALEADADAEALRFWESVQPAVIVGHSSLVSSDVHEGACMADGVPIVRRFTGGGAVVVGRGCLNFSLALSLDRRPELREVTSSYRLILGRIADALRVPGLAVRSVSDLAWHGRKICGSAQRRGRRALLHHGTLLYDFDVRLLERYLKEPARQPPYRAGRSHAAFVANAPLPRQAIEERIACAWGAAD